MLIPLGTPDGRKQWTVEADDGRVFAVFVVQGEYYVTDARCPHRGGPLVEGWIRGERTLVCPWHWFKYDLASGRCAAAGPYDDLGVYPVVERDGERFADVGEPAPERSLSEVLRAHAREG